jgi:alkylation response protein AidB-like acyl-CoA dehydrogenase
VLDGGKRFITNAGQAGTYIVTARTGTTDKGDAEISAFIVPADTPGFSIGRLEDKLGLHASATGELIFEGARIPADNLLGEQGKGFRTFLKVLDGGRISIAAMALGIAQGAYEAAAAYSKERQQFGRPIGTFQGVAFMVADMATEIEAARSLGMGTWARNVDIVLPQALRLVIPGIVNSFIALFKDTTLVLIVAIFDLLGQLRAAFADPTWATPVTLFTGFAFAGMIYFVVSFGMSRYALFMERRLSTERPR